jgi:hypothetical protein
MCGIRNKHFWYFSAVHFKKIPGKKQAFMVIFCVGGGGKGSTGIYINKVLIINKPFN